MDCSRDVLWSAATDHIMNETSLSILPGFRSKRKFFLSLCTCIETGWSRTHVCKGTSQEASPGFDKRGFGKRQHVINVGVISILGV
jgi:hypothetical protein